MREINKTYKFLKKEFIFEMDFLTSLGSKMFLCPFIGRTKFSTCCYHVTYGLLFLTSMQLVFTLCLKGFTDWFELVNIAPNLGVCVIILIKYGKIHKNKELYEKISHHFRYDLWGIVCDSREHRRILNVYTQTTKIITRFEYYYTIALAVVVDLFPRLIMAYETTILGKEQQYLYPFDGWYPFDKVKWYYVAYIWEAFMTTVVIFLYVFVNMLHISFTRHICMELKFLGSIVELLTYDKSKNSNIDNTRYRIRQKLKRIIKKHQFLAQIISEMDDVLGDGMLLTYMFGSIFICLTAFTATVVDDSYQSVRYFSFFCSLLVDTFFQCIMGQLLINHSEQLERAIYFADWVFADSETKKMLLIFLMRVQKPLCFSAKGYLIMNLVTFSGICSFSYQLFNLLRTSYLK